MSTTEKTPTTVVLERRSSALYAARTHTTKRTLLSDGAVEELCEAFIELHAAHNEQGLELDAARAEIERIKRTVELRFLQHAGSPEVAP
jgi:hypothetical protein